MSFGGVTRKALREISDESDVAYTTLCRFFVYRRDRRDRSPGKRFHTETLRNSTLSRIAKRLNEDVTWLRTGELSEQLPLGPLLSVEEVESARTSPLETLGIVTSFLAESRNIELQVRAARAAVNAMMHVVAESGVPLPLETYKALASLDAAGAHERVG